MRYPVMVRYIGLVLVLIGFFMAVSAGVGAIYDDGSSWILLVSGILLAGFGVFPMIFVPRAKGFSIPEAVFVVAGAWVATSVFGAIPFYLWGAPFTVVNAVFESFSGFTTTGASILTEVEPLSKGIVFWRSMTHWIGGTGIIVFALAILPALGPVSHTLLRREYTSLGQTPGFPRAREVARVIVLVYVGLTVLETILLVVAGVSVYEAATTAFGTIATGGFSPRNTSIAAYQSVSVEMIVLVFMVVSGINFAFLYGLLISRRAKVLGWEVVRIYLGLIAIGIVITAVSIHGRIYSTWGEAFRYASFQVASVGTSTGFATVDSSVWTPSAHLVLILLTFICACAGSTSGGIKVDRVALFGKLVVQRLKVLIHPQMVPSLRVGGRPMKLEQAEGAMLFVVFYVVIVALSGLVITFTGAELLESFTASLACMGNVGPGLGKVGSMGNYAGFSDIAKGVLCTVMLIGRLEIFVLILPFTGAFWRR
jgi:trk system potassium uptake protein TrkH